MRDLRNEPKGLLTRHELKKSVNYTLQDSNKPDLIRMTASGFFSAQFIASCLTPCLRVICYLFFSKFRCDSCHERRCEQGNTLKFPSNEIEICESKELVSVSRRVFTVFHF